MNEVRWIADHGAIDPYSLMMASSCWARLLLDATRKQLNHDLSRAGHLLIAGAFNYRRNLDGFFFVALGWKLEGALNTRNSCRDRKKWEGNVSVF